MNTCERLETKLADYLAGELSASDDAKVEAHLNDCPSCTHAMMQLQVASAKIREGLQPLAPDDKHGTLGDARRKTVLATMEKSPAPMKTEDAEPVSGTAFYLQPRIFIRVLIGLTLVAIVGYKLFQEWQAGSPAPAPEIVQPSVPRIVQPAGTSLGPAQQSSTNNPAAPSLETYYLTIKGEQGQLLTTYSFVVTSPLESGRSLRGLAWQGTRDLANQQLPTPPSAAFLTFDLAPPWIQLAVLQYYEQNEASHATIDTEKLTSLLSQVRHLLASQPPNPWTVSSLEPEVAQ